MKEFRNSLQYLYFSERNKMQSNLTVAKTCIPKFQINKLNRRTLASILEFLEESDLSSMIEGFKNSQFGEFVKMGTLKLVFMSYFTKVDRTYYFSVYDCPQIRSIQIDNIYQLSNQQNFCKIAAFPKKFNGLLRTISNFLPPHVGQVFSEKLREFMIQPEIPMPKLQRQSVASFVNSPFQSFLCSLEDKENMNLSYLDEICENMQSHVEQNEQSYFVKMMNTEEKLTKNLRYFSHQITYDNLSKMYAPNNELHNLLAGILGLTELYLSNIEEFLSTVEDSFELLLQITSRYLQFQNTVINFQENFGFMFQTFDQLYSEIYGKVPSNKFSFYKPAMKMWKAKMTQFHLKANQAFLNLLHRQLSKNYTEISENCINSQLSAKLLSIKNNATNSHQNMSKVFEIMVLNDQQDIQMLIANYSEYLVDMSITEQNCSYFSYSKFKFDEIYANMEQFLAEKQANIMEVFQQMTEENTKEEIEGILEQRLKNYHQFVKPSTIVKLMELYTNKNMGSFQMGEIKETDELIEIYNRRKLNSDCFNGKPLDDNSTMHSENSQSVNTDRYYDSEEQAMDQEVGGVQNY